MNVFVVETDVDDATMPNNCLVSPQLLVRNGSRQAVSNTDKDFRFKGTLLDFQTLAKIHLWRQDHTSSTYSGNGINRLSAVRAGC